MAPLTFRNSKIIYYGPHPCDNCGIDVAKMGNEWGGTAFTYPSGPVYPNTEWHPHVCDPFEVRNKLGREAKDRQLAKWPDAAPLQVNGMFVIVAYANKADSVPTVISHNCSFYDTELSAWAGADERDQRGNPTWRMHRATGETCDTYMHNAAVDAQRKK